METEEGHDVESGVEGDATEVHAADPAEQGVEEAQTGMPQLDPSSFDNQIFWLLLSLVAIFLIVRRVAMPRIGAILATREGTIRNDLAAAERLRGQARAAEAAYDRALADARGEANRIAAETRAAIQAQLDADLARADAEIERRGAEAAEALRAIERDAAANVREVARDVAGALVEALGGRADPQAIDAALARRGVA